MSKTDSCIPFEEFKDIGGYISMRPSSSSTLIPHLMSQGNEYDYRDEDSSLDSDAEVDLKKENSSNSKSKNIGLHFKRVSRSMGSILHLDVREKPDLSQDQDQDVELMTITLLDGNLDPTFDSPLEVVSENVRVLSSKSLQDKFKLRQKDGKNFEKIENFANISPRSVSGIDEISATSKAMQGIYRSGSSALSNRFITPSKSKVCFNEKSPDSSKIFLDSLMDSSDSSRHKVRNNLSRSQYHRKKLRFKQHRKTNSWSHFPIPDPSYGELSTAQSFDNDWDPSKSPSLSIFKNKIQAKGSLHQNLLGNRSYSGDSNTAETVIFEEHQSEKIVPPQKEKNEELSFELRKSMALATIQDDSPNTSPLRPTTLRKKNSKFKIRLGSGVKKLNSISHGNKMSKQSGEIQSTPCTCSLM